MDIISTLIEFYENRFPYRGKFYNDLSNTDKRVFNNHTVSVGEVREPNRKTVLKHFLMLNRTGKAMDEKHLKKVEEMLEMEDS